MEALLGLTRSGYIRKNWKKGRQSQQQDRRQMEAHAPCAKHSRRISPTVRPDLWAARGMGIKIFLGLPGKKQPACEYLGARQRRESFARSVPVFRVLPPTSRHGGADRANRLRVLALAKNGTDQAWTTTATCNPEPVKLVILFVGRPGWSSPAALSGLAL